MTDLTEQWKKGELPGGYYYCKLILNNMKPSVERCKAHCIPMGVSADKGEEVLAPVPSYDEWKASYNCMLENEVLRLKNAQLKELLKECLAHLTLGKYGTSVTPINILCDEVEEALK